jgi:proteasome lid subunit RPN8/RPN11
MMGGFSKTSDNLRLSLPSESEPIIYSSFSSSWSSVFEFKPYHKLYFLPKAAQKLLEYIAWEREPSVNSLRQAGLLRGIVYHDGETDVIFGEVHDIILFQDSSEKLKKRQYIENLKNFIQDTINQDHGDKKLKIIGLYRTHSKGNKIQPSASDKIIMQTLIPFLPKESCFMAVLDPHNTNWKAYWGYNPKECSGVIMNPPIEIDEKSINYPLVKHIETSELEQTTFKIIKKNELILDRVTTEFFIANYSINPELQGCLNTENILFLTKESKDLLFDHIGWGKKTEKNIVEQGGLLIGKPYQINDNIISIAHSIIPAESTSSNAAYLNMGNDAWGKMLAEYDNRYAEKDYKIIGWYHTHPNSLSVFMSGTDMGTQKLFFNKKWHFALVLNPHKKIAKAFYSVNGIECQLGRAGVPKK